MAKILGKTHSPDLTDADTHSLTLNAITVITISEGGKGVPEVAPTAGQKGVPPAATSDNTAKGIAITALFLTIVLIIVVIVLAIRQVL